MHDKEQHLDRLAAFLKERGFVYKDGVIEGRTTTILRFSEDELLDAEDPYSEAIEALDEARWSADMHYQESINQLRLLRDGAEWKNKLG